VFGGLEKTFGEIRWHVGGNVLGDLEDTYSAIFGEKMCRRFGEIILEKKTVRRFLEIWRKLLGEIVVGDLEKPFGDFGENCLVILEKTVWRFWIKLFGDFGDRYGVS